MKINLVENGIFPIEYDKDGKRLNDTPETGFKYSGTLQGEGLFIGIPSLFIRTSGCNLRCTFAGGELCDTPYSSFDAETNMEDIEDIIDTVINNIGPMRHIVITGGEPTLQGKPLVELCKRLKEEVPGVIITIETNGTIFVPLLAKYVDLFSISPKLSSSTPSKKLLPKMAMNHEKKRKNIKVLNSYIVSGKTVQLKFVITGPDDIKEIQEDFLDALEYQIPNDLIILMPEGIDPVKLAAKHIMVAEECIKNGWRFSPRLHIMIWNNLRSI